MQTFLPFAIFQQSADVLDKSRAWKQTLEAHQIINLLEAEAAGKEVKGWKNHPAVRQWRGYTNALKVYYNVFLDHCLNTLGMNIKKLKPREITGEIIYPPWLGYEPYHASHRARLLEKNFEFYSKYGWSEKPGPYLWPVDKDGNLLEEIVKNQS